MQHSRIMVQCSIHSRRDTGGRCCRILSAHIFYTLSKPRLYHDSVCENFLSNLFFVYRESWNCLVSNLKTGLRHVSVHNVKTYDHMTFIGCCMYVDVAASRNRLICTCELLFKNNLGRTHNASQSKVGSLIRVLLL